MLVWNIAMLHTAYHYQGLLPPLSTSATCQGNSLTLASCPPTILLDPEMPQIQEEFPINGLGGGGGVGVGGVVVVLVELSAGAQMTPAPS